MDFSFLDWELLQIGSYSSWIPTTKARNRADLMNVVEQII